MGYGLSQNLINEFVMEYKDGTSVTELANKYHSSRDTIVKYLKLNNVFKPKTHNWSNEMDEKLKEIYPSGDWNLISQTFPGRSRSWLYTKASQLGLHNENHFWSQHDKDILRKYYYIIPTEEIQKTLDKPYTIRLIQNQAKKMGLTKSQCWTDDEINIMQEKYSSLGAMDIMEFLPNKSYHAIIAKAVSMGLRCDIFWTDDEKQYVIDNWEHMSDVEMGEILGRSSSGVMEQRHKLGLYYPTLDRKYYDINDYIRHNNIDWKRRSMEYCNYKCILTGNSNFEVHHIYSFNLILKEAMQDDRWIDRDIKDYDESELKNILNIFNEYQDKYPLGACISTNIHKLFHSIYGNRCNTIEQWDEFEQNYKNGLYITSITD